MQRLLILLLLCFIALCAGVYISLPHREISIGTFAFPLSQREETVPHVVPKDQIRFVGDVMLARHVEELMDVYGSDYPYTFLPELPHNSFLVGNFEAAIPRTHVPTPSQKFSFSVDPVHLQGLAQYGFTHTGLSNNHSYDFGKDDFENTKTVLSEASFAAFGDPRVLNASSSISYVELASSTVALVGVYAVYESPSPEDIKTVMDAAAKNSDLQIAYVHWGEEYVLKHNKFQERLAQTLVDAGADLVVGHHPHVVQDIQVYNDVPIVYSLGNFIFDQYFSDDVQVGLALDVKPGKDLLHIDLIPVSSLGSHSTPRFMAESERDAFLEILAKKSEPEWGEMIKNGFIEVSFDE